MIGYTFYTYKLSTHGEETNEWEYNFSLKTLEEALSNAITEEDIEEFLRNDNTDTMFGRFNNYDIYCSLKKNGLPVDETSIKKKIVSRLLVDIDDAADDCEDVITFHNVALKRLEPGFHTFDSSTNKAYYYKTARPYFSLSTAEFLVKKHIMPHVSQDAIEGIAKRALGTFGFEELFKRLKKGEQINEETMAAEEIIDELRRWDKVRYKDWTIVYVHPKKEEE
jgi:hypothetical protein